MACLVSLRGSLPRAQAFVTAATGRGLATTTTTTTAFARRHHHLARHTVAAAAITTPRPPTERSLTGSPATLMFSSVGGPAEAAMATAVPAGPKHVLVPVADGSEEIESVTIIDTLVRAGALVTVASVGPEVEVRERNRLQSRSPPLLLSKYPRGLLVAWREGNDSSNCNGVSFFLGMATKCVDGWAITAGGHG